LGIHIAFGVGIGNFSSRRKRMEDYVRETNQRLALLPTPTRIVDWFHSTGNFVVHTPKTNQWDIANELSLALGVPCTVLARDEVTSCIAIAEKASSPPPETGIRWTKGIAFKVKGGACTSDLKPTIRAVFFRVNSYAVGVNKKDRLTDSGVLDKDDRAGGWGAASDDVSKTVGGMWTARSLARIQSLVKVANRHIAQPLFAIEGFCERSE
jgi:hypothetical protein